MNRDQFQKWIDEHGTGQRENKSRNGIDWVLRLFQVLCKHKKLI